MARAQRVALIEQIQNERKSFVITYITSTRTGIDVMMSMDVVRIFHDHLESIADKRKKIDIDLYIYSNGGEGTVPWRLVTLIREYAKKFSVIVPFNAFSAATLTSLGAEEIIMHTMGMLGPTDAAVANQFNPDDKRDPNKKIPINVEDITAYISLIKEDVGITHEDELVQAFSKLPEQLHPLALGNAKRTMSQSRMLAKKLLVQHMDVKDDHTINQIVDHLTSKLYFHGHPINRVEAKEIGLKVKNAEPELEKIIWSLYLEYEKEMNLTVPFNPLYEFIKQNPGLASQNFLNLNTPQGQIVQGGLGQAPNIAPTYSTSTGEDKLVFVESTKQTDYYLMGYELTGFKMIDGQYKLNTIVKSQKWEKE